MATFIPDTIDGSSIDVSTNAPIKTRGGLVTGITGDPATALDQCLAATGMPALGSTTTIGGRTVYFHRLVAKPVGTDTAAVQLVYDSDFGGQATAYIISYSSYLQAYTTNRVPGTRIPLLVPDWVDPADSNNKVPGDLAEATFDYPMRVISISGIKTGALPPVGTYDGWIGWANDSAWSGLPSGYWKITEGNQDVSKYSGFYSFKMAAVTKNIEDWSRIYTLYNRRAGIYVKVATADETDVIAAPYNYGIILDRPGILRVGPYKTTEFTSLFGF